MVQGGDEEDRDNVRLHKDNTIPQGQGEHDVTSTTTRKSTATVRTA